MMLTSLLFLTVARTCALQCPPADFSTVANFDLDTFMSARWYIQQQMAISVVPESWNSCAYSDYSRKASFWGYEIRVQNHAKDVTPPHDDHSVSLCARIVDANAGKVAVAPCWMPPIAAQPFWAIAYSEEEGYAIISGGPPTIAAPGGCRTDDGIKNSGFAIITRKQEKDPALIEKVRGIAAQKGFDLSVLNDVHQSDCSHDRQTQEPITDVKEGSKQKQDRDSTLNFAFILSFGYVSLTISMMTLFCISVMSWAIKRRSEKLLSADNDYNYIKLVA